MSRIAPPYRSKASCPPLPRGDYRGVACGALPKVIVTACLALAPAIAGALDADDVVDKVQARYDATEDFVAEVVQEMTVASLGKTITSKGTVAFKKPGRMRWEFLEDEPQVIVADGKTLWFYQPDEQQVFKAPFDTAFRSTTPISFLTGVGDIDEDFTVTLDGESDDGSLLYLLLVPKVESSDVGRLRLFVTSESLDIRGAEIHDPLGNVSRLEFRGVRRNIELDDARFEFEIPDGVDIISAPMAP